MAKTKLIDIIVPDVFAPYALERTTQLSRVIQCGAVGTDLQFNALANGPAKTVDMPFWKDLTGDSEVLSDSVELIPDKITAGQDSAAVHNRGKAWGANVLVKWLGGEDPVARIGDLVAGFWARDLQTMLMKTLDGLRQHQRRPAPHAPAQHLYRCRQPRRYRKAHWHHVYRCAAKARRSLARTRRRRHAQ
jgi:hypothetical protein